MVGGVGRSQEAGAGACVPVSSIGEVAPQRGSRGPKMLGTTSQAVDA